MRLLHTSDWHLGRSFHREDLLGAQAAFADHLVATVAAERVDCVLVSGDVYDRALPPVDAVRLYGETLERLAAHARVVVISGNHDSPVRLGVGSELLARAGVHVRTTAASVGRPVLVDDVAIYPIPYLEPDFVRTEWGLGQRSHTAALTEAVRRIDADGHRGPRVALAHAFVTSGEAPEDVASESERDISVGGVSVVPAGVFEGLDYAALGHLHGRRALTEAVRYSGSPLAYSFSEAEHRKGSWLVDIASDGLKEVSFVDAPVPRPLARIRGALEELLGSAAHEKYTGHWLQVTLTDAQRPPAAMERLRTRFPHALVLGFEPSAAVREERPWTERVRERSGLRLAQDFVADVSGAPASAAETALLADAFTACRQEERPAVPAPRTAEHARESVR